jgi:hypothetical protein
MRRSEMQLLARAIENQWEMPPEIKKHLATTVAKLAFDPTVAERTRLSAMKLLLAIDRNNIEWAKVELGTEQNHGDSARLDAVHRIAEVAVQLGFNDLAAKAIQVATGSDTHRAAEPPGNAAE